MQRWVLSSERDIASSLVSVNLDGHFTLSGSRDGELRLSQKMEAFALFLFPLNPSFRSSPWKNCLPPLQPLVLGLRYCIGGGIRCEMAESLHFTEERKFEVCFSAKCFRVDDACVLECVSWTHHHFSLAQNFKRTLSAMANSSIDEVASTGPGIRLFHFYVYYVTNFDIEKL